MMLGIYHLQVSNGKGVFRCYEAIGDETDG